MSDHSNSGHYSMVLEWDPEDDIYIVSIPELPGCRTHGRTADEAVEQGRYAMESWIEAAEAAGWPIPQPRIFAGGGA